MRKGQKHVSDSIKKMKVKGKTDNGVIVVWVGDKKKEWLDFAKKHFPAESSGRAKLSTMMKKFTEWCILNNITDPRKMVGVNEDVIKLKQERDALVVEKTKLESQIVLAQENLGLKDGRIKKLEEIKTKPVNYEAIWNLEKQIYEVFDSDLKKVWKLSEIAGKLKEIGTKPEDFETWDYSGENPVLIDDFQSVVERVLMNREGIVFKFYMGGWKYNEKFSEMEAEGLKFAKW